MIEAILPDWVSVVEAMGPPEERELDAVEIQTMGGAVDSRRREFSNGRWCARQAMLRLGRAAAPVPRGENREPLWPEGIVGSITHTKGYCAAAVALAANSVPNSISPVGQSSWPALGIDAEPDGPLPRGVLEKVSTAAERRHLAELPTDVNWGRLLFSAKESVYKALWPIVRQWIGFSDAEIRFDPQRGRFCVRVSGPVEVALEGRFCSAGGFVMTAVALVLAADIAIKADLPCNVNYIDRIESY